MMRHGLVGFLSAAIALSGCGNDDSGSGSPRPDGGNGDAGVPGKTDGAVSGMGLNIPSEFDGDCWQAATIPDVSGWGTAGGAYDLPAVSGSCSGDDFVITSNGIPTWEYVAITPNGLQEKNYTWTMPKKPAQAATTSEVPLLGNAAVTVTGLPIFGPTENPMDGYRDPYLDDTIRNLLDECNGHTAPQGTYHLHARPDCIVADLGGEAAGLVIGWAFDGYPILAPVACSGDDCAQTVRLASSWQLTLDAYTAENRGAAWDIHEYVEGLGDLDECNGMQIDNPDAPFDYAYFATDSFPYFMGCYRGTPRTNR